MALFTDGTISTPEDLRIYDSHILELASIEGVDLPAKLALAEKEVAVELQAFLARERGGEEIYGPDMISLEGLVVTEPLRQWLCLRTLSTIYRDVYHSQLNDRYLGRWKEFTRLDQSAARLLFETGLGMVNTPVQQADAAVVAVTPGSMEPTGYFIQVTWLNDLGGEGRPSPVVAVLANEFHSLQVEPQNRPAIATHWNVYAGNTESTIGRQNMLPIEASESWTLPIVGVIRGPKPTNGQIAEYFIRPGRSLRRG
ncbi:MAG TPA: hypothetical protein DEH78_13405 [Solibacterales bacterium]|nr:hypothetical protein [Bryobacterales bacterium]